MYRLVNLVWENSYPLEISTNHSMSRSVDHVWHALQLSTSFFVYVYAEFFLLSSAVVSYIYFTRIVVYLMRSTLPYNMVWSAAAAEELGALIFYCLVGWKFRPQNDNPYFKLAQEEEIQMQGL